jgi:hypothetical protein
MPTDNQAIPPNVGSLVSFDDLFARLVRITGWGLGVYAVLSKALQGTEVVALITFFVGFEFVARFRDRKLEELGKGRRED